MTLCQYSDNRGPVCRAAAAIGFVIVMAAGPTPAGTATDSMVPPERQVSDAEARTVLAQCEAALGRESRTRDVYHQLVQAATNAAAPLPPALLELPLLWGDTLAAERNVRRHLETTRNEPLAAARLADVLAAAQQFERAEGILRQLLLVTPEAPALRLRLAAIKRQEGDVDAALAILDGLLAKGAATAAALKAKGDLLVFLREWKAAAAAYTTLCDLPDARIDGLLGLGRCEFGQGRNEAAARLFQQVLDADATNLPAHFFALLCAGRDPSGDDPLARLDKSGSARGLVAWAELCNEHGLATAAGRTFRYAVARHGESYAARLGLARTLASQRQFAEAIGIYQSLQAGFPESFVVRLEWARALSWARQYDDALTLYARLIEEDPTNVVTGRELARVAVWARRHADAADYYGRLYNPPLDAALAQVLAAAPAPFAPALQAIREQVANRAGDPPYDAYEWLFEEGHANHLPPEVAPYLEAVRLRFLAAYDMQKAAFLEAREKQLTADKRPWHAWRRARELATFTPGNQEALHDLSQLEFALGLDREAVRTARRLDRISPAHNLAPRILETAGIRERAYLLGSDSRWHEEGRGDLVHIDRQSREAGAGMPILGRGQIEVATRKGEVWAGTPTARFAASGASVRGHGVLTSWLAANGNFTLTDYGDVAIPDTQTGHLEGRANVRDLGSLRLRRERADELFNEYGLRREMQSDAWALEGHSWITRCLEITALGRLADYSDGNRGDLANVNLACSLTEHPGIFKPAIFAENRNTDEVTRYLYTGDRLTDIIHPYWTPVDYQAWGLMLEWGHDISPIYTRGTDHRNYDLLMTLRDDTEDNATVELKGTLHYEFRRRWYFGGEAAFIRSKQWDGKGLVLTLRRHF